MITKGPVIVNKPSFREPDEDYIVGGSPEVKSGRMTFPLYRAFAIEIHP